MNINASFAESDEMDAWIDWVNGQTPDPLPQDLGRGMGWANVNEAVPFEVTAAYADSL